MPSVNDMEMFPLVLLEGRSPGVRDGGQRSGDVPMHNPEDGYNGISTKAGDPESLAEGNSLHSERIPN